VARMRAPEIIHGIPNIDRRHGDGRAEVIGIAVLDANGWPVYLLESRSRIVVRISVRAREEVPRPIVGFLIRNHLGLDFSGANTAREGQELPALRAGEICTVDFHLDLPELYPGPFSFSPAVVDGTLEEHDVCDWIENALALEVARGELEIYGFVHLPCRVQVNARLEQKTDAIEHPERKLG
jgi:lipopolysaccharide transport system ATP-binding protein